MCETKAPTPQDLAEFLASKGNSKTIVMKLLYYFACVCRKLKWKLDLAPMEFEHWPFGPVLPPSFRNWETINRNGCSKEFVTSIPLYYICILEAINIKLANANASQLVEVSHESTPWKQTSENEVLNLDLFGDNHFEQDLISYVRDHVKRSLSDDPQASLEFHLLLRGVSKKRIDRAKLYSLQNPSEVPNYD